MKDKKKENWEKKNDFYLVYIEAKKKQLKALKEYNRHLIGDLEDDMTNDMEHEFMKDDPGEKINLSSFEKKQLLVEMM